MTGIWRKIYALIPGIAASAAAPAMAADVGNDKAWQATYSAREKYYQESFGKFPQDILKLVSLLGVWPGGGLFAIPPDKLGKGIWVYTTFGLSNVDMPTTVTADDLQVKKDKLGRVVESTSALKSKAPASAATGIAGYGYELVVLARENAQWPLAILQWSAQAEILKDVGFLKRVEKYHGLTVSDIQVGDDENDAVNLLFAKAQAPLPTGATLPNGRMDIIVVTVITADEMEWSMTNGRDALLAKLIASGAGQISDRKRKSVL